MTSILINRQTAAQALSISTVTLDRLIKDGKINTVRVGRRVLFSDSDILKFVAKCRRESK